MNEITLKHVAQAVEWAKGAAAPQPIDGLVRKYSQAQWDCGTTCCIWGAASIIAGNGPATCGPSEAWAAQSHKHAALSGLMRSVMSSIEMIENLLRGADLGNADLSGADLRETDLSGANLRNADLSGANLRKADLSETDLSGADLSGADLSGADLSGANLSDTDLSDTDLSGADLSETDLRGATISLGNVCVKIAD